MTLTLNISTDAEKKLRERASAEGKEPSAYAAEIVEHALSAGNMASCTSQVLANSEVGASSPTILPPPTAAAVDDFLKEVEQLEPDPKRPRLRGQEAEIEAMIVEKHLLNRSRR